MTMFIRASLLLALLACSGAALAIESGLPEFENQSLFSPKFLERAFEAEKGGHPAKGLEAFYKTLTNPAEQAEIELRIARVYNQRTGFVDHAQAVAWYDKALVRELPLPALAGQLILRGNSNELLGNRDLALRDYIRGLLICLHFNLPERWPNEQGGKLPVPALNNGLDLGEGDVEAAARRQGERQAWADYRRETEVTRREQTLLMHRFHYVEAIKRVVGKDKLDDAALREAVARLSHRDDRIELALKLIRGANPWPVP
jgi:hypothetical protein